MPNHTCSVGTCRRDAWPLAPFDICPEHYQEIARHFAALQRAEAAATRKTAARTITRNSMRAKHDRGIVYFIRFRDLIKIGTTQDLTRRLTAIPHDELLRTVPGGPDTEAQWHLRFRHLHVRGEWFRDEPELREAIAAA